MKLVLIVAVFCVVPCAFQDVWDEYDTWYDDFNNLDSGELVKNIDEENAPETIQDNKNKEIDDGHDYIDEQDYKDYEIEDNRDGVKTKFDKEEEPNQDQDLEENDQNIESAVQDFDVFQQIMNNDKISEDAIDKILDDDENRKIYFDASLPEELPNPKSADDDDIPRIQLGTNSFKVLLDDIDVNEKAEEEKEQPVQDIPLEQEEDNVNTGDEGVQSDIGDINYENEPLVQTIDEDNDDETKDVKEVNDDLNSENEVQDDLLKMFQEVLNKNEQINPEVDVSEADVEADMNSLIDETRKILEETNSDFDEDKVDKEEQENVNLPETNVVADIESFIDETREILERTNNEFDENHDKVQKNIEETNPIAPVLETEKEEGDETDNIDKDLDDQVYEDLNEDLDKLFETLTNLANDNDETDNAENEQAVEERANVNDGELSDEDKDNNFDYDGEARILQRRKEYYDYMMNNDLKDLFKEFEDADDVEEDSPTNNANEDNEESPIVYVNDALDAAASVNSKQNMTHIASIKPPKINDSVVEETKSAPKTIVNDLVSNEKSIPANAAKLVEDLTSSELDELSKQFVILHESEINMERDVAPVHITLTADEPVVITSPDYPNAYPTDSAVIDWILEGLGTGIEVNITDLAINSAQGHFLMLKPGQSDASGDLGIIFAHRINSERRYRFRDVNRMFVRFNPLGGMSFSRGFRLSARMIESPASDENEEDLPDPESLIPEPHETATLLLAGVNSTTFLEIREQFRMLLADMATMYINVNGLDPGMNTTDVVTQIIRSYVCNVNWPGFDSCVQVTFGVPLVYEDENATPRLTQSDLMDMWSTLSIRDPFAARLSRMGISDYSVPKDSYILTLWVVIGVGVLIAAAMLAVALWRYSCYENYTRMQEFSDTDSIHDKKRGLDMYPTPHQTLPPLYTENDYKWADLTFNDSTRVDMGGFTNNTFTRDDLSDESEVDVAVSRDRNSYKPRDFNVV